MKKYFAIALTFIMLFVFMGCGNSKYTAPISVKMLGEGNTVTMIEDFASDRLLEILNDGNWEVGLYDCVSSFYLTVNGHKIGYSSSGMIFNNTTNGKSLKLDNATAMEVEEIFYSLDFNFEGGKMPEFVYDREADIPYMLEGEIISVSNGSITVKTELYDGLGIVVSTNFLEGYGYKSDISNISVGDRVRVLYDGKVAESYPPQILSVYSINKVE